MVNLSEKEILELIDEAVEISKKAYVNYSHFPVGAVLIDENGRKFKGVNVENASFGLSLCAERNAITTAVTDGMKKIKHWWLQEILINQSVHAGHADSLCWNSLMRIQ